MNFFKKNKKIAHKRGFTLVESLVAISILSISILSAFTAVQSSLQATSFAEDRITAYFLLQDTAEHIRNIRDQNMLWSNNAVLTGGTARDWLYGLSANASDPCYFGKTCMIDVPASTATACAGVWDSCEYLKEDPVTGLFGYNSSWTATNFKRAVQFTSISPTEVLVTITIVWKTGSKTTLLRVEQSLFNRL